MDISESGLHIINGLSAAGSWKQAFHSTERLLVQQDSISCGPTPYCSGLSDWEKIRVEYLNEIYVFLNKMGDIKDFNFKDLACDLLTNADRLNEHNAIYVWAGTGIEDQFLILFVTYLTDLVGADPNKIKLIQYEKLPTRNFLVHGIGELNPETIRNHPHPTSLQTKDVEQFKLAWLAITADTPTEMENFINECDFNFPYIKKALQYLLRRYPQRKSGLTYWDWSLLKNTLANEPNAARIIGYTMAGDSANDGDRVDDSFLFHRLLELASDRNNRPLIKLDGKLQSCRDTTATVTDFGKAVLNGETSSYPTNPIDEWIGGVHLSSEQNNLWFHDLDGLHKTQ